MILDKTYIIRYSLYFFFFFFLAVPGSSIYAQDVDDEGEMFWGEDEDDEEDDEEDEESQEDDSSSKNQDPSGMFPVRSDIVDHSSAPVVSPRERENPGDFFASTGQHSFGDSKGGGFKNTITNPNRSSYNTRKIKNYKKTATKTFETDVFETDVIDTDILETYY